MRMTAERLEAFKKLYCDRFGIQLTNEEALAKSLSVVRLMELTYKPMKKEEYGAFEARRIGLLTN